MRTQRPAVCGSSIVNVYLFICLCIYVVYVSTIRLLFGRLRVSECAVLIVSELFRPNRVVSGTFFPDPGFLPNRPNGSTRAARGIAGVSLTREPGELAGVP